MTSNKAKEVASITVAMAVAPASSYCSSRPMMSSGTISESEATSAYSAGAERRKEMFKTGDLNHDGYITSDELKDTKTFSQMDVNKDNRISEDEYLAWNLKATANAFDKTDSNNDKSVSAQEMKDAIQKRIDARKNKE